MVSVLALAAAVSVGAASYGSGSQTAPDDSEALLVIGEVVDHIVIPGGQRGTIIRVWEPPSRADLEKYMRVLSRTLGADAM